jgi:hypothetical protein
MGEVEVDWKASRAAGAGLAALGVAEVLEV